MVKLRNQKEKNKKQRADDLEPFTDLDESLRGIRNEIATWQARMPAHQP